ncbi:hypothetical protein PV08_05407 [Exophiala spinifera]|uniref:Uncharacterized protein n=1 Tax=Exophiala spinifera TaxID=91928 RepID=A0A0D1YK48_9EURO|nr:uncharacterized protein PV08_05407 [Exophiala spinifera]KIW15361.1 hypothetical protein PV08_05407 [Exophiala spinifera]
MATTVQVGHGSGDSSDQSYPLAAQIPLKEFTLPDFPPQASRLRELTLTADIKLDEYQTLLQTQTPLTQPELLPNVPRSVTHLTLELFGLGFPGNTTPALGFLGRLAKCLPNLRSLTFFSCLIDGLDDASRRDAEELFESCTQIQEIHVIDSFSRPGFFTRVGSILEKRAAARNSSSAGGGVDVDVDTKDASGGDRDGLKVVNVSYTFRGHEDSDFLARVAGEELASLIVPGLIGVSFDFVPASRRDELDEPSGQEGENTGDAKKKNDEKMPEGVLPFASDGRAATAIRKRFETASAGGALTSIKVLNLGMFSLRPVEVGEIVYACAGGAGADANGATGTGLVDLTVAVLLEDGWADDLVAGLGYNGVGRALEGIEIVGVPGAKAEAGIIVDKTEEVDKEQRQSNDNGGRTGIKLIDLADVEKLAKSCPKLGKVGMSILKVKSAPDVVFVKKEDGGLEFNLRNEVEYNTTQ